jgi:hypothetical protein
MQINRIIFIGLLSFAALLQANAATAQGFSVEKDRPMHYQSFGNSVGEIALVLQADKKFELWYKSYQDKKSFKLKGKWGKQGKDIRLVFQGKKYNFEQLFPESKRTKNFKVVNQKTVQFNSEDTGLFVWGVFCMKQ